MEKLERDPLVLLSVVARLMRTRADARARTYGMTRAQWAVLVRLDRAEGLNQSELAEMLDLQPITLTRLLDKLADSGLIERRPDPDDRRAKRLFLTPAARPLLEHLGVVGEDIMGAALDGLEPPAIEQMLGQLDVVRGNLRRLIHQRHATAAAGERHYG